MKIPRKVAPSIAFLLMLFPLISGAQIPVDNFFNDNIQDIRKLIGAYAEPFIKGEGLAIANGWHATGKPHKPLGFDIMISASSAFLPSDTRFFTFIPSQYKSIRLAQSGENQIPTFIGDNRPGPILGAEFAGATIEFNTPEGVDMPEWSGKTLTYMPVVQAGLGLIAGTDLKLRYWPEVQIGKTRNKGIGAAIMHDVGQWIPFVERRGINLSLLAGFTRLQSSYNFTDTGPSLNQESLFSIYSVTFQAIVSKEVAFMTFFIGGGYHIIHSDLSYQGEFRLENQNGDVLHGVIDPVSLSLKYNSPTASTGFRIKASALFIHGSLAIAKYPVAAVGIGMSVR